MSSTGVVPQTFLEDVSKAMKVCLVDGKLDSGELLKLAVLVAENANKIENLSDDDKKNLVLVSVETALKQNLTPEQFEKVESKFVLEVLPTVLDIALSAAHGKFDLKKSVEKVGMVGWLSCLSCASSAVEAPVAVEPSVVVVDAVAEPSVVVELSPSVKCIPAQPPLAAEPALVAVQPQNLSVRVPEKNSLLSPSL
jgi:hypothetical protein